MIQKFLSAKHWQLFLPIFGLPLIIQSMLLGFTISRVAQGRGDVMLFENLIFILLPILTILMTAGLFGWLWSIGIGLNEKLAPELQLPTTKFKAALILPAVYISVALLVVFGLGPVLVAVATNTLVIAPIILLHLLSFCCVIYGLYFVAKTINTAELNRPVGFSDFAGDFFLLWFWPVGIWLIQPRVNELAGEEKMSHFL